MSHTPGPWTAQFGEQSGYDCMTAAWLIVADVRPFRIAAVDLGSYGQSPRTGDILETASDTAEADAHLIAAAPELLAALKETLAYWDSCGFSDCDEGCECIVQSVQAAIAKAEGKP